LDTLFTEIEQNCENPIVWDNVDEGMMCERQIEDDCWLGDFKVETAALLLETFSIELQIRQKEG
jgi:hypothetical protein